MDFKKFTAGENDSNRRLDKIIRKFIPDISLSQVYKYIRKGLIKINEKKTSAEYKVQTGDNISIAEFIFAEKESVSKKKIFQPLPDVVFENNHILILDKPYDMLVHGSDNSLDKIVLNHFQSNSHSDSLSFTPGPLHRIDRKTTGLICFSKSLKGAQWFSEILRDHKIQKKYLSIVQGIISKKEIWEDFIARHENNKKGFHTVKADTNKIENGKTAYTEVTPLKTGKYKNIPFTLVEFYIKTGRTHQIRSQSALHKHPLLGDVAYGGCKLTEGKQDFYLQSRELIFPENELHIPHIVKLEQSKNLTNFLNYCDNNKSGL